MRYTTKMMLSMAGTGLLMCQPAMATDTDQAQSQTQQQVFGSQLMTPQERTEYRAKLRAAKTMEERERLRAEHHAEMMKRAKAQGVTLPDEPPAGGGMGPGGGMGGGMGPGGGMGRGRQ